MASPEHESLAPVPDIAIIAQHEVWSQSEPYWPAGLLFPAPLSLETAQELQRTTYAAVLAGNEQDGAVLELKVPQRDLHGLNALSIPTCLAFGLYQTPTAPVIRLAVTLHDQPDDPLSLFAFVNPNDLDERVRLRELGRQETLLLRFYDQQLRPQFHFEANLGRLRELDELIARADRLLAHLPPGDVNYPLARNRVMLWGDHPAVTGDDDSSSV